MKFLKKSIFLASVILTSISIEAQITGNGNMVSRQRDVSDFSAIRVSSGIDVYVNQGATEALTIEAEENLQDVIVSEVTGGVLKIYVKKGTRIMKSKGMDAYITARELKAVSVSGGGDVTSQSKIESSSLDFNVSGGGDLDFSLASEQTSCNVSGGGDVDLAGTVGKFDCRLSGGGDLELHGMAGTVSLKISGGGDAEIDTDGKTERFDIDLTGGGDLDVSADAGEFRTFLSGGGDAVISAGNNVGASDISITGGGDLDLNLGTEKMVLNLSGGGDASMKGSAKQLDAKVMSGSDVNAGAFKVGDAMLQLTGGSDARFFVTGTADITASGGGEIYLKGNPQVKNAKLTGGSKLHTD